jgi:hypothetical protein
LFSQEGDLLASLLDFIHFGRLRDFSSNKKKEQEKKSILGLNSALDSFTSMLFIFFYKSNE